MFVVFLRAVNLGARNKVPQKPLAASLAAALGVRVQAYLQSGNLVVGGGSRAQLAPLVSDLIREATGLEIPAVVRSVAELQQVLAANPWPDEEPTKVHLSMWDGEHDPAAAAAISASDWAGDEVAFVGPNAWLHFVGQSNASKLAPGIEKKLKVVATARNLRTIRAVTVLDPN